MNVSELGRSFRATTALTLRSDLVSILAALVMVVMLTTGIVASQRSLVAAQEDSLALALDDAGGEQVRLGVVVVDEFGQGTTTDPLEPATAAVDAVAATIDPTVLDLYGSPRHAIDAPSVTVVDVDGTTPASPTTVVMRVHDGLDARADVVAGRPPTSIDERVDGLRVVEVAMTAESLSTMGWGVGTETIVESDPSDPLFRVFTGVPDPFVLRIVASLELDPVDDPYWAGDGRLHRPVVTDTAVGAEFTVFASVAPDQLPGVVSVFGGRSGLRVEQRRDLDRTRIDLGNVDTVERAVTRLESSTTTNASLGQPAVTIGLRPVLAEESDRRDVTRAAAAIAAIGAIAVGVAVLVQFQRVASARRRPLWRQVRSRGSSAATLVASSVTVMAIAVGVGVVFGVVCGAAIADGADTASADQGRLLATLVIVLVGAATADQVVEVRSRLDDGGRRSRARIRRAIAVLVVIVAAASVVSLRRRGIRFDGGEIDPLLLIAVVAVPLAAIVVVQAALPRIIGSRRIGSLRLGVGRLVGTRRGLAVHTEPGVLPVMAIATSVAVLGVVVAGAVGDGIVNESWRSVGAPARLDTTEAELADQLADAPEVVASRFGEGRALVESQGSTSAVVIVSLDAAEYAELTAGTPVERGFPAGLGDPLDDGTIPAVVTPIVDDRRVQIGDTLDGIGARSDLRLTVVATSEDVFGRDVDAVLVDRDALQAQTGRVPTLELTWFDGSAPPDVADDPGARIVEREDVEAELRSRPLAEAARAAFLVAAVAAVALAIAAVVAHLAVTMRERRRDVGLLAALGADRREFGRAIRAELLPAATLGIALGTATGVLTAMMLDGRVDLAPLTGGSEAAITPDPLATLAVVLGVFGLTVVAIGVAGRWATATRADAVRVLRAEAAT